MYKSFWFSKSAGCRICAGCNMCSPELCYCLVCGDSAVNNWTTDRFEATCIRSWSILFCNPLELSLCRTPGFSSDQCSESPWNAAQADPCRWPSNNRKLSHGWVELHWDTSCLLGRRTATLFPLAWMPWLNLVQAKHPMSWKYFK